MPQLEQTAYNTVAKYYSRSVTATFTTPTIPGSCLILSVTIAGGVPLNFRVNSGTSGTWQLLGNRSLRDIQQLVYIQANAPRTTAVTVSNDFGGALGDRSMQIRVMEYSGCHATSPVDKANVGMGESRTPFSGYSGTSAQADSAVVGIVASQYASTTVGGFSGGLVRLFDTTSPLQQGRAYNQDWERSRCTIHHALPTTTASFFLYALLSAVRRWICFIIVLKGGSSGPVKLSSTNRRFPIAISGYSSLTVFGPLRVSLASSRLSPMMAGVGKQARIGPFVYQYRLGGWSGLLIGDGTPYTVETHEGLEGWTMRTSDDELPRGDGALRGVDLMTARQILFEIKLGSDERGALNQQTDVEDQLDDLYRALIPQRDQDWELIWRHPGRPLRMIRVRPTDMMRELDWVQTVAQKQKFVLIASDPRHYSAFSRTATIRNTPASGVVTPVNVINEGNGNAYPRIRISGPTTTPPITRVELINADYDCAFVVAASVNPNSTLIGDMEARATGAARSVVTVDGQSKYGAWQHPRSTWYLGPGQNNVHLLTTPAGAPGVTVTLDYRDTWSG